MRRVVRSDVARHGSIVFVSILAANVFNYAFYLLLGRAVSVRDYGVAMSLFSIVLFVIGLGTIGQTVIAKLAADLRAAGDRERCSAFAHGILRACGVVAVVIFSGGVLARGAVAAYLHIAAPWTIGLAAGAAALGFVLPLQRGLFQGEAAFGPFAISTVSDGIVKAAFLLPFARWFGVDGAVGAFFAATVISALFGAVAIRVHFGAFGASRLDMRRIARTSGATGLATIAITVLMFYDVVIAKHYLAPEQAGLYGAAALAGRTLFTVVAFLPTVLLPDVAARRAGGRSSRGVLFAAVGIAFALCAGAALVCALAPKAVLGGLAGHGFSDASNLVLRYVIAAGALSLANVLAVYAVARHRLGFAPFLAVTALAEIALVTFRHGSALDIVTDVVAGHVAVGTVMAFWLAIDGLRSSALDRHTSLAPQ